MSVYVRLHTHTHIYIYVYILLYTCIYVYKNQCTCPSMQGICLCLVYHACNTILTYCWLPSVFFRWFAHGLVKPIGNSTEWTQSAVKCKAFENGAKSMVTESAMTVIEIARFLFSKQAKTAGPQWRTLPCSSAKTFADNDVISVVSKKFPYSRKGNFWGRQKSPVHPWMKPTNVPPAKELASATLREKRKHVVLRTVRWPMELLLEAWSTGGLTKLGCIATVGCWNFFQLYNYEACFGNTLCLGGKEWIPIIRWFHVRKRDLAPCCCRPKLLPCPMAPSPPKTRSTACLALASFRRILLNTGLCNGLCPHGRQQNCKRQCSQWSDQGKSRCNLQTCTTAGHSSFHFPTQNLCVRQKHAFKCCVGCLLESTVYTPCPHHAQRFKDTLYIFVPCIQSMLRSLNAFAPCHFSTSSRRLVAKLNLAVFVIYLANSWRSFPWPDVPGWNLGPTHFLAASDLDNSWESIPLKLYIN